MGLEPLGRLNLFRTYQFCGFYYHFPFLAGLRVFFVFQFGLINEGLVFNKRRCFCLCCSFAAVESPTTQTGLKSTTPPVFQIPAAWNTVITVAWTTQELGGQR